MPELLNLSDLKKIDSYFIPTPKKALSAKPRKWTRAEIIKFTKLALPAFSALLIGLLIIIPQLKKDINDVAADIITPTKGELEKFHMEKGIFYITDSQNLVNNFHADSLDETEAGSKIIKMINPKGTLPTQQQEEVHIYSPVGFYDQNKKILTLQQGVHIDYSAGITSITDEMFVDFDKNKAYGVKPITTTSESAKIKAEGFEYYKDKDLLVYTGKNHTVIKADNIDGGI